MKQKIALKILILFISLVTLFHLAVIAKLIPYTIAWGGRLQSDSQMYVFECLSILINLFLIWVLLMKGGYAHNSFRPKAVTVILWVFLIIFVLNTIGNIFAKTTFEKFFAIITLAFAVLIATILKTKNTNA